MTNEEFYSTAESAQFLGISVRKFQYLRQSGIIIPDKFGKNNSVFYSKVQLQKFQATIQNAIVAISSGTCVSQMNEVAEEINDNAIVGYLNNVLPMEHFHEITKLGDKLKIADPNKDFKTALNGSKSIFTFARLDYDLDVVQFDRKFDVIDELILNTIYSFSMAGFEYFTPRNILQHVFGNVADHFQQEIVEIVENHLERMTYMKLTFILKDILGNDAYINIRGEHYRPTALKESLLDVSMLELKSKIFGKRVVVYKLNKKSPIFRYAESLNQITAWSVHYMAVPCRKTIQNAVIMHYLLTKISLVKNKNNHYLNTGILFDTLHRELQLDVSTRKKKKNIRDVVKIMFDYWIKIKLLISYEFLKSKQAFHKIVFNVNMSGV